MAEALTAASVDVEERRLVKKRRRGEVSVVVQIGGEKLPSFDFLGH